ncbi:MAG: PLP-dependent aspartate aminotransferase family protein [Deferrisomatales bacterium]|nr:PLP-dependent aspartate aminotransferase family protein [Deferrisomatales bacterium]
MDIETRLARVGLGSDPATGAVSTPIHPSSTYAHPGLGETTGFDYARTGNPTRQVLERALADLEGGVAGFAFASGMAALTTFFLLFRPGDHVVVSDDLYGGTYRLLEQVFRRFNVRASYADLTDREAAATAITSDTRALLLETPSNPLMKVADLVALADLSRSRGVLLAVDNTFLTPYYQRPLELGADLVIHSATKYLGGHNDLLAGVLVAREADLAHRLGFLHNTTGPVLPPQDSWLLLRSLKTLGVRLKRQSESAAHLAGFLREQASVTQVFYPGFEDHPGHRVMRRQTSGFGGMLSFRLADPERVPGFLKALRCVTFAESLGGVETLVTVPSRQTHCDIPPLVRERMGVTDDLLRLSVGLEAPQDLIKDLDRALKAAP